MVFRSGYAVSLQKEPLRGILEATIRSDNLTGHLSTTDHRPNF